MSELSERAASGSFPAVANAEVEATKLNQGALEFMLGAQKMMFEELVFFGDEMLERTRTALAQFEAALDDDLNAAEALGAIGRASSGRRWRTRAHPPDADGTSAT